MVIVQATMEGYEMTVFWKVVTITIMVISGIELLLIAAACIDEHFVDIVEEFEVRERDAVPHPS